MIKKTLFLLIIAALFIFTSCASKELDYYTGSVESERFDVSSEVAGVIKDIYVEEGDFVKKGYKIATIDVTDLKLELGRLKAELGASKSTLEKTKSGFRAEEISKAQIQLEQQLSIIEGSKSAYENSLENYERLRELYENGAASKQSLDESKTNLDIAASNLESSNMQYEYLAKQLELMQNGPTREDVQIPQSKYEAMLWSIKSIENKISKQNIYANSDGIVESLNYLEGEYAPMFSKLASINDLSRTWAKIYVEEKNLYRVSVGGHVKVTADFLKGGALDGIVTYISSEGEFTPKNIESKENKQEIVYEVKVEISDKESRLKPGMLVDVFLEGDQIGK